MVYYWIYKAYVWDDGTNRPQGATIVQDDGTIEERVHPDRIRVKKPCGFDGIFVPLYRSLVCAMENPNPTWMTTGGTPS